MAVQRSGSSIDMRAFDIDEPRVEQVQEVGMFTIRIHLPGFKKEQLRVQLSGSSSLKVSGERPPQPGTSTSRWTRFQKEFLVPQGSNLGEIRAKFANGILTLTVPKLQQGAPDQEPAPQPQPKPAPEQDNSQQHKPPSPSRPKETQQPAAVSQPPPADETKDVKDKNSDEKKDDTPAAAPAAPGSSINNAARSAAAEASAEGLRRRLSFEPRIPYSGGLRTKSGVTGFKTAAALVLLMAGLWFAYVNYWARREITGDASLAPY